MSGIFERGGCPHSRGVRRMGKFCISPVGSLHILIDLPLFRPHGKTVVWYDLINSFILNFLFWNNYRLTSSCKNSIGRFCGPRISFSSRWHLQLIIKTRKFVGSVWLTRLQTLLRCHHFFACTNFLSLYVFVDHHMTHLVVFFFFFPNLTNKPILRFQHWKDCNNHFTYYFPKSYHTIPAIISTVCLTLEFSLKTNRL